MPRTNLIDNFLTRVTFRPPYSPAIASEVVDQIVHVTANVCDVVRIDELPAARR